ncbi:hypothetical protein BOX15_Mlig009452g1 [Macrostomum lignano]|uniref:Cadherin domain-containing protein n=2 Tax=Macrostomum lignano TaxID=282301 RepID=A0A267GY20_9PLAT|nr:hypothetical protein BOX15_Mlig009452g1 [Macrostomum lignano]
MSHRPLDWWLVPLSLLLALQPVWSMQRQVSFSTVEEQPPGTLVGSLLDSLDSASENATFGIIPNKGDGVSTSGDAYFSVDSNGQVRVRQRIDRDQLEQCNRRLQLPNPHLLEQCVLNFQVFRFSSSAQMMFDATVDVRISILDINDNAPSWSRHSLEARLSEDFPVRQTFRVEAAKDRDYGPNGTLSYELKDASGTFSIATYHPDSSIEWIAISVDKPLDREVIEKYNLTLVAKDSAPSPRSASIKLFVLMEDVNDHAPVFNQSHYSLSVNESAPYPRPILQLKADDPDKGRNGEVEYIFAEATPAAVLKHFRLDPMRGSVTLKQTLDYEKADSRLFHFAIVARDRAQSPRSSTAQVTIAVLDVNDCPPQLTVYKMSPPTGMRETSKLTLKENSPANSLLGIAVLTDGDSDAAGDASCEVQAAQSDRFRLNLFREVPNQKTYQIVSRQVFDREQRDSYRLSIECRDRGNPPLSSTVQLDVDIEDVNDESPSFAQSRYEFRVRENLPPMSRVGGIDAADRDAGRNGRVSYAIDQASPDADLFRLGSTSRGDIFTSTSLDREQKSELRFSLIATDHGSPSRNATTQVVVRVIDENDVAPKFSAEQFTYELFEGEPIGTLVGNLTAFDDDEGLNANISYSIQSPLAQAVPFSIVSLDSGGRTAQIRTSAKVDREALVLLANRADEKAYMFTVRAMDRGHPPLTGTCRVKVIILDRNDNSPDWIVPSAQLSAVNVSRHEQTDRAFIELKAVDSDDGDFGRVRYSILAGDPHGLFSIDSIGGGLKLRRKPTSVGRYRLTLSASDCPGCNESRSSTARLTVNVIDAPARPPRLDNRGIAGGSGGGGGDNRGGRRTGVDDVSDVGIDEQHLIIGLIVCTAAVAILAVCAILLARCLLARIAHSGAAKRAIEKQQRETDMAHQEALLFGDRLPAGFPDGAAATAGGTPRVRPAIGCGSPGEDSGKGGSSIDGGCGYQVSTLANFDKIYIQQQQHLQSRTRNRQQNQNQQQQYTTLLPASSHLHPNQQQQRTLPQYYEIVQGSNSSTGQTSADDVPARAYTIQQPQQPHHQQQQTTQQSSTLSRTAPRPIFQASSFV